DLAPEVEARVLLRHGERPPPEPLDPADRLEMKRREDVYKILIRYLIMSVKTVDPGQRLAAARAVVAPFHDLGHEQRRVVISPLRTLLELAASHQHRRGRRHTERAVERHLERA